MLIRGLMLGCIVMACAGCAGETQLGKAFSTPSVTTAALASPSPSPGEMPRKTMSDRILAAIALERVTGLKPDPSRLTSN